MVTLGFKPSSSDSRWQVSSLHWKFSSFSELLWPSHGAGPDQPLLRTDLYLWAWELNPTGLRARRAGCPLPGHSCPWQSWLFVTLCESIIVFFLFHHLDSGPAFRQSEMPIPLRVFLLSLIFYNHFRQKRSQAGSALGYLCICLINQKLIKG